MFSCVCVYIQGKETMTLYIAILSFFPTEKNAYKVPLHLQILKSQATSEAS